MTREIWTIGGFSALTLAFVMLVGQVQVQAQTATGPTAASALSADEAINQAILTGNGDIEALARRRLDRRKRLWRHRR